MEELRLAALDAGVKGYVEATASKAPQGELRYLQMTLDRRTKKIQLVLVWNAKDIRTSEQSLLRLTKLLRTRRPDLWHSITINFNTRTNNNIFDYDKKQWKLMFGPEFMKEKVGDAIFLFKPQIFRQANLDAFENGIIPLVVEYVNNFPLTKVKQASEDPTLVVSELYSGIGLLGLNIASRFQPRDGVDIEVFCSDSNEFVDAVFEDGVKSLPEASIRLIALTTLKSLTRILHSVGNPRKGLLRVSRRRRGGRSWAVESRTHPCRRPSKKRSERRSPVLAS